MEAVPRMPMLAFELKTSPELVEFTPSLKAVSMISILKYYYTCWQILVVLHSVNVAHLLLGWAGLVLD